MYGGILTAQVVHNQNTNAWGTSLKQRDFWADGEGDVDPQDLPYSACCTVKYPKQTELWGTSYSDIYLLASDWLNLLDTINGADYVSWSNGAPNGDTWAGYFEDAHVVASIDICFDVEDGGDVDIWSEDFNILHPQWTLSLDMQDGSERTFGAYFNLLLNS